jgi:hypothetical protein
VKIFPCPACGNVLYFENTVCGQCGHKLAYDPACATLLALEADESGLGAVGGESRRFLCANSTQSACNWLVPEGKQDSYCTACRHNGTVPDLSVPKNLIDWQELEAAKHRLFYSLLRWQLQLRTRSEDPAHGLIFNFLADTPTARVVTGHDNGVITIALAEADVIERERRRLTMGEPYRTLLGHFRHEVGHYYWDVLVRNGDSLSDFRSLFGDDSEDYQKALERHYHDGAPSNWQQFYVSAYASAHPWEDFAETWAHYLHIVDTLEMAGDFGIEVRPTIGAPEGLSARIDFDPYTIADFKSLVDVWLPFVFAMNSVSRAIGTRDLYPFVLAPAVIEKMSFIHNLVQRARKAASDPQTRAA